MTGFENEEKPTSLEVGRDGRQRKSCWPEPFIRGEIIGDSLRIDGVLGAGGMGVVYLAHDLRIGRAVAIKVSRDPAYDRLLQREAQALSTVRHPGLVTVHGLGTHRGHDYMVLERLLGRTLQDRIDSGKLSFAVDEALDLGIGICDALSAVHRAGLAHRDLKPSNVFVCGGRLVLLDFGLFIPEYDVGHHDEVAGSVEYMSPEVIGNSVVPGAGPLVDLYALGVILFELLAGRVPFSADVDAAILRKHLIEPVPDLSKLRPDVPHALVQLIEGLLEKDPANRTASAEAALWQLCAIRGSSARTGVSAYRVLVVDDDPGIGSVLRRALKQALPQLVVESETDPRRALAEIERDPPDLVLTDLNMPEMNGIELMMQLSAIPDSRRSRVVGISAEAEEQDIAAWRALGVVDFVPKDNSFVARISSIVAELRHR
jgi:eukaryotic-like serine/threonine-protein kinase